MINDEGQMATMQNTKAMIRAQNDLYKVTLDARMNTAGDNTLPPLKEKSWQGLDFNAAQKYLSGPDFLSLHG